MVHESIQLFAILLQSYKIVIMISSVMIFFILIPELLNRRLGNYKKCMSAFHVLRSTGKMARIEL